LKQTKLHIAKIIRRTTLATHPDFPEVLPTSIYTTDDPGFVTFEIHFSPRVQMVNPADLINTPNN